MFAVTLPETNERLELSGSPLEIPLYPIPSGLASRSRSHSPSNCRRVSPGRVPGRLPPLG